jgi:hypothetical protein
LDVRVIGAAACKYTQLVRGAGDAACKGAFLDLVTQLKKVQVVQPVSVQYWA